jgi:CDP-diacylglycerol--serine O-phosphatidyltransferase
MGKIPNIITLSNAVCGLLAIFLGNPIIGSFLIIAAMLLDVFDGLAARKLGVDSDLGQELDSLADLISFGVAPAFLFYQLFHTTEALVVAIFYVLSGLFRLAKFNTLAYSTTFNGLPIPAAAGILSGFVLLYAQNSPDMTEVLPYLAVLLPAISMNIHMSFFSLKQDGIFQDWKLWTVVLMTILGLYIHWSYGLIACFMSYLAVSFLSGLFRRFTSDK